MRVSMTHTSTLRTTDASLEAYRAVWYAQGWRSDDDPLYTGDPADPPPTLDERQSIDLTLARLEAIGAAVDQTAARTEAERWRELIRDAGSASPGHASFVFLGGDITDTVLASNGDQINLGADLFAGPDVTDDFYEGDALPIRNSAIVEDPPGTFANQINGGTTSTPWLVPNQGTYPGTHYWPICCTMDPGNTDRLLVGCWLVDSDITETAPYGTLLDTHVLSCSLAFGGAVAQTFPLGLGTGGPWILKFFTDTDGTIFVLFEDFHPAYSPGVEDEPIYGQGDAVADHHTRIKLARSTAANADVPANWQWWNGTTWGTSPAAAAVLRDSAGDPVRGDADITRIADGTYRMVGHTLVDTHADIYSADTITGPWTRIARVPCPSMGAHVNGGRQIGQFARWVEHVDADPETTICALALNLLDPTGDWPDRNIRRYAPLFFAAPHHP